MKIDITPSLNIFNTYKNFGYKMPSALFEYFDNSTSSFFEKGKKTDERYVITLVDRRDKDNKKLMVIDNAFGMNEEDFIRAIRIDNKLKKSGRNKFGVGLKVSAIWFSDVWSVESLEEGTNEYRKFIFDLEEIQNSETPEFEGELINKKYIADDYSLDFTHGTIITLNNPRDLPVNKPSVEKLANDIASQFSNDIKEENVKFIIAEVTENRNGSIEFVDLVEKYFGETGSRHIRQNLSKSTPVKVKEIKWKKVNGYFENQEVNIDVVNPNNPSDMYTITGVVGWIENSGVGKGGFKRLWKNRALESSLWKPEDILGKPNGYVAQRMYGELNFDHFEPTNSKDGFIIDSDLEYAIIETLASELRTLKSKINKVSKAEATKKKTNKLKDIEKSFSKNANAVFDKNSNVTYKPTLADIDSEKTKNGLFQIQGKSVNIWITLTDDFDNDDLIKEFKSDDKNFDYYFRVNENHSLIAYASPDNLNNIMRMIYIVCYSEVVSRVNYYVKNHFEPSFYINNLNKNFFKGDEDE